MGRLATSNTIDANALTAVTSETINYGVYNFLDDSGNVTQIKKSVTKERLLFYPDAVNVQKIEPTVIGVSDTNPMGTGDVGSNSEQVYAIY